MGRSLLLNQTKKDKKRGYFRNLSCEASQPVSLDGEEFQPLCYFARSSGPPLTSGLFTYQSD